MTRNLRAADWTSKFVEANGIRHHYLEWGDASKPALLMLHATGLCAWPWKPVDRELAQDYRVLAFDQRGHGDTDRSDRGYRFEFVGDDLAAIVEKPDLERPRVIGHSSGGLSAILAANLIPDRLGPVVLMETRVSNDVATVPTQDLNLRAERTRMKRAVWESREAMFAAYRTRAAFRDWERWNFQATHWPQSDPGLTRFHNVPNIGVNLVHRKLAATEPAPGHYLNEFGLIY